MSRENKNKGIEMNKEIISIKNGSLFSSIDGEIKMPNLDKYWVEKLIEGDDCYDIKKEQKYSYINLCSDLQDYYGLIDSCWNNNLVPSMNFDIKEHVSCWIGFPNSNNNCDDNEEWNQFTIYYQDDSKYSNEWEEFNSYNECRFDTIEEVLSFIKSNWDLKEIPQHYSPNSNVTKDEDLKEEIQFLADLVDVYEDVAETLNEDSWRVDILNRIIGRLKK